MQSKGCIRLCLFPLWCSYWVIRSRVPRFLCCSGMPCIMMRSLRLWWATAAPTGTRLVCGDRDRERRRKEKKIKLIQVLILLHKCISQWLKKKKKKSDIHHLYSMRWRVKQTKRHRKEHTEQKQNWQREHYKHLHKIKKWMQA